MPINCTNLLLLSTDLLKEIALLRNLPSYLTFALIFATLIDLPSLSRTDYYCPIELCQHALSVQTMNSKSIFG